MIWPKKRLLHSALQWAENTALDPFVHKAKKLTKIPQRLPRKNTGNLKNNFKEFFKNSDWFYR